MSKGALPTCRVSANAPFHAFKSTRFWKRAEGFSLVARGLMLVAAVSATCCSQTEPEPPPGYGAIAQVTQSQVETMAIEALPAELATRYAAEVLPPLETAEVQLAAGSERVNVPVRTAAPLAHMRDDSGFAEVVALAGDQLATASAFASAPLRILRQGTGEWIEEATFENLGEDAACQNVRLALTEDSLAVGATQFFTTEGAHKESTDGSLVRTYRRTASGWVPDLTLTPPEGALGGHFGHAVALDTSTLIVAAPFAKAGTVYVYTRESGSWTLQQELLGSVQGDRFGWSVALQGETLVIGAPGDDRSGADAEADAWGSGAAYVFMQRSGRWEQTAFLKASDAGTREAPACRGMACLSVPPAVEEFGYDVDVDDGLIVVGSPGAGLPRVPAGTPYAKGPGAAYVFSRTLDSPTWREVSRLTTPGPVIGFGTGVQVVAGTVAVSSPRERAVPGRLPQQVDTGTIAVFQGAANSPEWHSDMTLQFPSEPSMPVRRFALSANVLAISSFRRAPDGGLVETFNLASGTK